MRIAFTLGIALSLSAGSAIAAPKMSKAEIAAVGATPEDIARSAKVTDDPFAPVIEVSTQPFFRLRQGLLGIVPGDKFMRAFIDRKTGATSYQMYVWTIYAGDWQFFDRLAYIGDDGPVQIKVIQISRDVLGCSRYGGCTHSEHFAADIPESVLRSASAGAKAGTDETWRVKIYGKTSEGAETGILKTEIAGFLIAVDRVKQNLSPLNASPAEGQ